MTAPTRRRVLGVAGSTGLAAAGILALVSPPADAAPVTESYEFTGTVEDFVVPAGVFVKIKA